MLFIFIDVLMIDIFKLYGYRFLYFVLYFNMGNGVLIEEINYNLVCFIIV